MAIDISSGASQFIGAADMGRQQANYAGQVGRQKIEQVKGAIGSIAGTFGEMRKQEEAKKALDSWAEKVGFKVAPDDPIRQDPKLFTMGILNHVKENADEIARKHQEEMQKAQFGQQTGLAQMNAGYDMARQATAFENDAKRREAERKAAADAKALADAKQAEQDSRFSRVAAPEITEVRGGTFGFNSPLAKKPPVGQSANPFALTPPASRGIPDYPSVKREFPSAATMAQRNADAPMDPDTFIKLLGMARPESRPVDPAKAALTQAQTQEALSRAGLLNAQARTAGQPEAPKTPTELELARIREIDAKIAAMNARPKPLDPVTLQRIVTLRTAMGNEYDTDAKQQYMTQIEELLSGKSATLGGAAPAQTAPAGGPTPDELAEMDAAGMMWDAATKSVVPKR